MKQWLQTDDTQFVNKVNESTFEMVEMQNLNDEVYVINHEYIDLTDYEESDIIEYIEPYGYDSIQVVKDMYGTDYKQVIAECIFESLNDTRYFSSLTESECIELLKQDFGITL